MTPDAPKPVPAGAPPAEAPPQRRRRVLRWLVGLLIALAVLVVLIAGLTWYTVSSERGARFVLQRADSYLPGELSAGSVEGRLTGPLELEDVRYRTDGMNVHIDRLALDWDARDLRRRLFDVQYLRADGVRIVLPPAKEEDETEDGRLVDVHLPVNIIVREGLIRDVTIVRPGQEPFRLSEIALEGRTRPGSDALLVRNLRVVGPTFRLQAQGELTPVGAYEVDLQVRATYDPPEYPPFVVAGDLGGTLERLGVSARLSQPFDALVRGHVLTPMRELGMDLSAQVRNFEAQEINPEWPLARISQGNLKIQGKLDDFKSEGTITGAYEDYGSGVADYRLARRGEELFFEYLNLKTDEGTDLSLKGTVGIGGDAPSFDVAADWERLAWPLQGGAPVAVSREGEATVRGTLNDYEVDVQARIAGPNIPPGRWVLAGRGGQEGMTLRSLRADVLGGNLAAEGVFTWKPQVTWRLQVAGNSLNPGAQWPEWPGNLTFAGASQGVLRDAGPYGQVEINRLDGSLRDNPVAGRVRLELAGERYRLPRLDLRSGSARLTASGAFTADAADLDWRLAAPNLAEALPRAGGSLMAEGHLSGPWKTPAIRARAEGDSLVYQDYNAEDLTLVANVDLSRNGPILLDLDAASVGVGERRFETVSLDAQGTRRDHEIALAVRAEEGSLDLGLAGGLAGTTTWDGVIRRLDLQNEQTGAWRLAQPAPLTAGTERASLQDFCWVSSDGGARLCAEGRWAQAGPWSASGTVEDLPFSLLEPFLPPDLEITGDIQGRFSGQGTPAGVVTADVDLRPGPGEIRYPTESGETAQVRYDEGLVTLTAGADGLTGRAAFTFPDTGTLEAGLRLPQYNQIGAPLQQQTLDGRIAANLRDLGLVEAFVPDLDDVRGTLTAGFDLAGTVAQPRVVGAAELRQAQMDVPEYGLELRQVELTARSDGQGPIDVSGSARSGGGNLSISGAIAMDGQPARFEIDGRNFLASDTRQARVIVSPDLQVTVAEGRIEVTGDVRVPEAEIVQQDRRAAIPVSGDVVIISGEEVVEAEGSPWEVFARVRVILGEEVEVKASGFTGEIDGSLLLTERPERPTTAVGELVIEEGRYKAYGQDLTIERGRIIYAGGPLDNPGLDLRAFRKAADGTVAGINVRGTLDSPQTTLYSDPPMGQSEALAYLLLGRPLGQASTEDTDLLARAADSLGLRGGNLLARKLGARFGLEEARVETTGGLDDASLVLGKYLSPRLYVNYGIGLFEPVSIFRIRYILGREWTLQAEQGEGTSADILYTVERGKGGEAPVPERDKGEPVAVPAGEGGGR